MHFTPTCSANILLFLPVEPREGCRMASLDISETASHILIFLQLGNYLNINFVLINSSVKQPRLLLFPAHYSPWFAVWEIFWIFPCSLLLFSCCFFLIISFKSSNNIVATFGNINDFYFGKYHSFNYEDWREYSDASMAHKERSKINSAITYMAWRWKLVKYNNRLWWILFRICESFTSPADITMTKQKFSFPIL